MRSDDVALLMMSKRFLVLVFFGSAFVAAAADGATTAVSDSVSMGSAADHETSSDPTAGPDASKAAEAATSSSSLTDQLENTADSGAQMTTKSEVPAENAETTTAEPGQGATGSVVSEAAGDSATASAATATPASDPGTSVAGTQSAMGASDATGVQAGASSTIILGTFDGTGGQSTGNDPVQHPGRSSIASEKGVTTEPEMASATLSQGGGAASQTGSEKDPDGTVQAATDEAKVSDDMTKVSRKVEEGTSTTIPLKVDEDKSTTIPVNVDEDKSKPGSPIDVITPDPQIKGEEARLTVWEAHRGLFIGILIMVACVLVIGALCFVCFKCREKSPSDKQRITLEEGITVPMEASSPIPDAEMVKDEAPMQEVENPAVTPNGGGQHISKDEEDNGWVVPLEELSKTEKEKPETENTKL